MGTQSGLHKNSEWPFFSQKIYTAPYSAESEAPCHDTLPQWKFLDYQMRIVHLDDIESKLQNYAIIQTEMFIIKDKILKSVPYTSNK